MMGKENRYDIALFLLKSVSRRCNSTFILSSPTINIAMRPPITCLCKAVMASAVVGLSFYVFYWLAVHSGHLLIVFDSRDTLVDVLDVASKSKRGVF